MEHNLLALFEVEQTNEVNKSGIREALSTGELRYFITED
jgi:hypothetical protein